MALVDNFDSYNDGDLNGQGGWAGHSSFDVHADYRYGAAGKGVGNTTGSFVSIAKGFTAQNVGGQTFYIKGSNNAISVIYVRFFDGATECITIKMDNDGKIYYLIGVAPFWVSLGNWASNTWYKIDVQWDGTRAGGNGEARYRLNDGEWTGWAGLWAAIDDGIDKLDFLCLAPSGYWDEFSELYIPPPAVGRSQGLII